MNSGATETRDALHPSVGRARDILALEPHERIAGLVDYWLTIHPRDRLPGRQHFEPVDIPRLLPHIVLVDVEPNEMRFFARVAGGAVCAAFGFEITGKYLDDVVPEFRQSFGHEHRVELVTSGLPNYRKGKSSMAFRLDFAPIERVHLPLAKDGKTVDQIVSMTLYEAQRH